MPEKPAPTTTTSTDEGRLRVTDCGSATGADIVVLLCGVWVGLGAVVRAHGVRACGIERGELRE
jgi:hypothetical protein